jgi:hypothetical protein
VSQEDVLGHSQVIDEVEFLVDRGDAGLGGGLRPAERGLRAAPEQRARVRTVHPREHLDQGRLTRAVLPEQAVHLTGQHLQVHAVQGPDTGKGLDDVREPQQRLGTAALSRVVPGRVVLDRVALDRVALDRIALDRVALGHFDTSIQVCDAEASITAWVRTAARKPSPNIGNPSGTPPPPTAA